MSLVMLPFRSASTSETESAFCRSVRIPASRDDTVRAAAATFSREPPMSDGRSFMTLSRLSTASTTLFLSVSPTVSVSWSSDSVRSKPELVRDTGIRSPSSPGPAVVSWTKRRPSAVSTLIEAVVSEPSFSQPSVSRIVTSTWSSASSIDCTLPAATPAMCTSSSGFRPLASENSATTTVTPGRNGIER